MLTESPQTQAAFEALAKILILDYANSATDKLTKSYQEHEAWVNGRTGDDFMYRINASAFGIWSIGASGAKGSFKQTPVLQPFKEFLKDFWELILRARSPRGQNAYPAHPSMADSGGEVRGNYHTRQFYDGTVNREISIFVTDLSAVHEALGKPVYELHLAIVNQLSERESTIVHELVHAYDDWISKGKFNKGRKSLKAKELKTKADAATGEDARGARQVAVKAYLNDPVEINARFTQTVKQIGNTRSRRVWNDFYENFRWAFPGWDILSPNDKSRLTKRLAIIWTHGRRPDRHDITKWTWKLEDKITNDFGVTLHLDNMDASGVIRCRHYSDDKPMTAQVQAKVLAVLVQFADMWNRTLTIDDGLFSSGLIQHYGFVANKGRNEDYRFSSPFYRKSRRDGRKPK